MHSSRMRTARSLLYGVSLTETLHGQRPPPGQRPPGQRLPLGRDPLDRYPPGQRRPLDRDPLVM